MICFKTVSVQVKQQLVFILTKMIKMFTRSPRKTSKFEELIREQQTATRKCDKKMKKFSIACLVAQVYFVAKKTHPHQETRPCRNCDKKNATRQAIENFWPCRVSALILKFSCRVVRDKTRILVSSADQPLSKISVQKYS